MKEFDGPLSQRELELTTLEVEGDRFRNRFHLNARWRTPFVARLLKTIAARDAALRSIEQCSTACEHCKSVAWGARNAMPEERDDDNDTRSKT